MRHANEMETNRNCPVAAVRPTPIMAASPRCAPTIGIIVWQTASANASIRAKCPISGITGSALHRTLGHGLLDVLLVLGQGVGYLRRHVVLVMLGHNLVCGKDLVLAHAAMRHDALPLT